MKISSANKTKTTVLKSSSTSLFDKAPDPAADPIDLVDVEILSGESADLSSGRVEFSLSTMNERLIGTGFETVELVVEEKPNTQLSSRATAKEINDFFEKEKSQQKPTAEKKLILDLKQNVSNNKLTQIAVNNINEVEDDEVIELEFVKSATTQFDTQKLPSATVSATNEQSDNTGTLEIRLGKNNETFADQKIDELSSFSLDTNNGEIIDNVSIENTSFNVSRPSSAATFDVPDKSPLLIALESPTTNRGNKRAPNLSRVSDIKNSGLRVQANIQRPLIKSIKRVKKPAITTERRILDLPGPTSYISVKITNRETGEVIKKPLRPRRLNTVPYKKIYPYKKDVNLPKIDVSPIGGSQAIVSLTNIDPCFNKITIYRREISSRSFEDTYEEVNALSNPPESFSFIDNLENARAFKYVCVADNLPLYSFTIFRNSGFKYENLQEPFVFAFQNNQNVIINVDRLPTFCKKLFVFRKSSAEDQEQLVDSINLFGKATDSLRLIDNPSPIEQVIEYRFVWIDENGIENQFEEKPKVVYTAKLGLENANIIRFNALYDSETNEVNLSGEATVENLFIADKDSELSNPSKRTLDAAARNQNIVKIQLRRINLKTEDDEIILKEIINPGISKFDSQVLAQNRLSFKFVDSGENAAIFGYTPLLDNTDYTYIARIIVYPLGLELRKVANFDTIEGIRSPGRLKYTYDPGVFNHPLNTELGILPGDTGTKSFIIADIVGQTTRAISRNVKVFASDIEDSITLSTEIKLDSALDPVIKLVGSLPNGLLNELDHLQIEMSYDTIRKTDIIDRLFLLKNNFEYYDYAFDDLACNQVGYRLIGIGKDFSVIFKSEPTLVSLKNPKLRSAKNRRNSLINYREKKSAEESKAKRSKLDFILQSRGLRDGQ